MQFTDSMGADPVLGMYYSFFYLHIFITLCMHVLLILCYIYYIMYACEDMYYPFFLLYSLLCMHVKICIIHSFCYIYYTMYACGDMYYPFVLLYLLHYEEMYNTHKVFYLHM